MPEARDRTDGYAFLFKTHDVPPPWAAPREVKLGRGPYAPKRLRRSAPERWM